MASAKEEILNRIREAAVGPAPVPSKPEEILHLSHSEAVEQFADYAAEYRANVIRCSIDSLGLSVAKAVSDRESKKLVVAPGFPLGWLGGVNATIDEGFDSLTLDKFDAVVTQCAFAIAETGTVVLDAGVGQGRRAITLIPDHHICVVMEDQVVDSVPEAVNGLAESVANGQPLTWISGPSATSDIELSRVEGVHGPRVLDIILVSSKEG